MGYIGVTDKVRFPVLGGRDGGVGLIVIPNLYICSVSFSVPVFYFIIKVENENGHQDQLGTKIIQATGETAMV